MKWKYRPQTSPGATQGVATPVEGANFEGKPRNTSEGVFGYSDLTREVPGQSLAVRASAISTIDKNHFAIRKRCVLPAWWVCGYLARHLSADLSLILPQLRDSHVLLGTDIPPRCFYLLCVVWNEMWRLVAAGNGRQTSVQIDLQKHVKGTSTEISEQLSFLETYWASPLLALNHSGGKISATKAKIHRAGRAKAALNCVRHSRIVHGETVTLRLDLASPLEDFCLGRFTRESELGSEVAGAGEVVSANPDVLLAFGTGRSLKKICSYLLVEFVKRSSSGMELEEGGWYGGVLDAKSLSGFHKDLLSRTKALYDHGVFGWDNSAPRARVSDVRRSMSDGCESGSGLLHLFRVSEQTLCARKVESELIHRLEASGVENGKPILSLVETENSVMPSTSLQDIREIRRAVPQISTDSIDPKPLINAQPADSDLEFIVRVADYYASLSEEMRELFEIERARMTPEEFKVFISAILRAKTPPRRR